MKGFGIDPNTLALRPSTLIQDRAGRESRAQQASQYQRTRQDSRDKFAQTMASQEATRKADFAKTQFMANHNLELQRAKTKAGLLEDMANEKKRVTNQIESRAHTDTTTYIKNGFATADQYQQIKSRFISLYTGQAPAPQPTAQPQPQVQPQQNSGQPQYELTDPYTQMQPVIGAEGEMGYALGNRANKPYEQWTEQDIAAAKAQGTLPWELQPIKEPTLADINKGVLDEAVAALPASQPKPAPKPQVPQSVAGTDYEEKYTLLQEELKNAPKVSRKSFTKTGAFGKAKKFDQKGYSAAIKASNSAKRKTKKEMADIVIDAKQVGKLTIAEAKYIDDFLYGETGLIESVDGKNTPEKIKSEWNKRKNSIPKKLRAIIEQRIGQETEDEVSAEIDKLLGM